MLNTFAPQIILWIIIIVQDVHGEHTHLEILLKEVVMNVDVRKIITFKATIVLNVHMVSQLRKITRKMSVKRLFVLLILGSRSIVVKDVHEDQGHQ